MLLFYVLERVIFFSLSNLIWILYFFFLDYWVLECNRKFDLCYYFDVLEYFFMMKIDLKFFIYYFYCKEKVGLFFYNIEVNRYEIFIRNWLKLMVVVVIVVVVDILFCF